ncbi:MAG TPA: winged helix-turn-helix domain-containing protein [archaeon]|nr:winged helix-turn-helix domain-containing protein [archaeon]
MKKIELVYREILYQTIEKKSRKLTQLDLSKTLQISISTVHHALKPLKKMGCIRVKLKGLEIVDPKKILLYWASIRNLEKDVIYQTRVSKPVDEIEKSMPGDVVFAAYSAYKFMFKKMPADYSEVYVYANDIEEIKKRFPENKNPPNLFVLKKEFNEMVLANLFADLWNLKEWYAKAFLKELEDKLNL